MFLTTLVLFLLPSSLLWAAWKGFGRATRKTPSPKWRQYFGIAAIVLALCSTVLELVFFYSWFHNGGSPHGMMPSPGIWKFVGRISFLALLGSVALSAFGKGKWRLLIPAWAASFLFAAYAIFMLERD
jgi:hypothetical protein